MAKVIAINLYGNSIESAGGNGAIILTNPDTPVNLQEHTDSRGAKAIGLMWDNGAENGGASIIDHRVTYSSDYDGNVFTQTGIPNSPYVFINLYTGSTYTFQIEAKNSYGYSPISGVVMIYCAFVPTQVDSVVTSVVGPNVVITWSEPVDNGSIITSYTITIRQKDESYSEDLVGCDGTKSAIVNNRQCEVELTTLYAAPFNLIGGDDVYAKVVASNLYGPSVESDPGHGAQIVLVPDAPLQLRDEPTITSETQVGLIWTDGAFNGGMPVIDYTVSYDQATGNWVELESGILTQSYTSTAVLTSGADH